MRPLRDSSGNAAVEAAIVLPLWIFALLGVLQLALFQQARLLTEYAAYQAARAGIVHNGDPSAMQRAAIFVLAPTTCPTRVPGARELCRAPAGVWQRQLASMAALETLSSHHALIFPGVHVHTLSPYWPKHAHLFDVASGTELDFDFFEDRPDERREATLLTVQVQYWFELKIPFADWVIWSAYLAKRGGLAARGSISDPVLDPAASPSLVEHGEPEGRLARLVQASRPPAEAELHRGDRYRPIAKRSWAAMVGSGLQGGRRNQRTYFIPIVAHHTMRMQSNFFSHHIRDCSCSSGDNCTATCRAW